MESKVIGVESLCLEGLVDYSIQAEVRSTLGTLHPAEALPKTRQPPAKHCTWLQCEWHHNFEVWTANCTWLQTDWHHNFEVWIAKFGLPLSSFQSSKSYNACRHTGFLGWSPS